MQPGSVTHAFSKHPTKGDVPQAEAVITHYDGFACRYDGDRFETSYGRYVHAQECRLLRRWLPAVERGPILDLGCGTGRLLDFATHGLDGSPNMIAVAQQKHPHKTVHLGRIEHLDGLGLRFRAIFCLHVFMHLTPKIMEQVLDGCWRHTEARGVLVFDVPSRPRRRLTGFRPETWHANNALELSEIKTLLADRWRLTAWRGILWLPIHRIPHWMRPILRPLDDLLGTTPVKRWASYWMFRAERHP